MNLEPGRKGPFGRRPETKIDSMAMPKPRRPLAVTPEPPGPPQMEQPVEMTRRVRPARPGRSRDASIGSMF